MQRIDQMVWNKSINKWMERTLLREASQLIKYMNQAVQKLTI
jgi:hypothetical protein